MVCGTVAVPADAGGRRVPAVVFMGGSGPTDRDGTVGEWRPLRDLAWALAGVGIASLRFDERTTTANPGVIATVEDEVLRDARAALDVLGAQPAVDNNAIFAIGHSLGGMLVPRLLGTTPNIRGGVLLAANSRPLHVVLVEQLRRLVQLGHASYARHLDAALKLARDIEDGTLAEGMYFGAPASYWLDLAAYDPVQTLRDVGAPVLLIFGDRDTQVFETDVLLWRDGLVAYPDATLKRYPELDHFLMAGALADTATPRQVDPRVFAAIADWIKLQLHQKE